jgi:tight adherence protein B
LSHWWGTVSSDIGPIEVAAPVGGAVALLFLAVSFTLTRPSRDLAKHLEGYQIPTKQGSSKGDGVVTLPPLRRLSDLLSGVAKERGISDAIEKKISQAGLMISTGELMAVVAIGGVLLAFAGAVVGGPLGFIASAVIAGLAPAAVLNFLASKRTREFDTQLPDVLKLLSASLRAGFSLLQGLDSLVAQVGEPMGTELRRAFASTRVGLPVEEALQSVAERVGSRDFEWVVMAIQIQREVGGNLAEILDSVAQTMMARSSLRREVRTLTAEGRISAYVLVGLPPALGVMVFSVNHTYISVLFNTRPGNIALLVGLVMEAVGGLWLRKTVTIEI